MQITLIGYGRLNSRLEDHSDRKKPTHPKKTGNLHIFSKPSDSTIYLEDTPKPSTWQQDLHLKDVGVSKNRGTPKSSILIRLSIINHPFWGTPIFGNTHILPNPVHGNQIFIQKMSLFKKSFTPWKFNIAPENIQSQKESSLPTIIFQGLC